MSAGGRSADEIEVDVRRGTAAGRLRVADQIDRDADKIEVDVERELAGDKPMPEHRIAALRAQARRRAEGLRRYSASLRAPRLPLTDAELVESYAFLTGVNLAAPGALVTLCAKAIRRYDPEFATDPALETPDHWPEERLARLVYDVSMQGNGGDLVHIERLLRRRSGGYRDETVRSLQRRLQEARRLFGIAAPRGKPPRIG